MSVRVARLLFPQLHKIMRLSALVPIAALAGTATASITSAFKKPLVPPNSLENSTDYQQPSIKRPEPAILNDSQHFRSRLPRRQQRSQPRFPSPPLLAPHASYRLLSTLMYVTLVIRPCYGFLAHEVSLRYAKDQL
jgi:hypothetical protein